MATLNKSDCPSVPVIFDAKYSVLSSTDNAGWATEYSLELNGNSTISFHISPSNVALYNFNRVDF